MLYNLKHVVFHDFLNTDTLMILKNLSLILTGVIIATLFLSLLVAYYFLEVEIIDTNDIILFTEHKGRVLLNKPKNLIESLQCFFGVLYHFLFPRKRKTLTIKRNQHDRNILRCILVVFLIISACGLWLSFDLQYRVNSRLEELNDIIEKREYEKLEEYDRRYHEWIDGKQKEPIP